MSTLTDQDLLLHKRFSEYGMNAKEWLRKCALMLPEIDDRQIWKKKGFGSVFEYAAILAGMSKNQVYDALRIIRRIEDKPALKKIVEEKGLNAIRPIVTIATPETQEFWAEKAKNLTVNELRTYVRDVRTEKSINRSEFGNIPKPQPVKTSITIDIDPIILKQLEKIKGSGTWEEAISKLLKIREEKLEKEKPEPVKTGSRHIPEKIKRFVIERDNGICVFPRCTKEYSEFHHTEGFAIDHIHDPDKIYLLCETHHSLAHKSLIENETLPPSQWKIRETANIFSPRFIIDQLTTAHKQLTSVSNHTELAL